MICPKCHKTYKSGRFCIECGASLVEENNKSLFSRLKKNLLAR